MGKDRITIIGSGNWGSAIAKIVTVNARKFPHEFEDTVNIWVFEEVYQGRKLTEIINTDHENKKYLPGVRLPHNLRAIPDIVDSVKDATILVFVMPHQFLEKICNQIKNHIAPGCRAISLIKGISVTEKGPRLLSEDINKSLGVDVSVLMGANIAAEVAKELFSEATIGYSKLENGILFQKLFDIDYFKVNIVEDVAGVEMCGALKNIVALAVGFADGMELPGNTKAAIIRVGLLEMKRFMKHFYKTVKDDTLWESCGIADVLVSCLEGRNRKCAEQFVRTGKTFDQIEKDLLNGQKLQGTLTADEVHRCLLNLNMVEDFPLFWAVYAIVYKQMPPREILKYVAVQSSRL